MPISQEGATAHDSSRILTMQGCTDLALELPVEAIGHGDGDGGDRNPEHLLTAHTPPGGLAGRLGRAPGPQWSSTVASGDGCASDAPACSPKTC